MTLFSALDTSIDIQQLKSSRSFCRVGNVVVCWLDFIKYLATSGSLFEPHFNSYSSEKMSSSFLLHRSLVWHHPRKTFACVRKDRDGLKLSTRKTASFWSGLARILTKLLNRKNGNRTLVWKNDGDFLGTNAVNFVHLRLVFFFFLVTQGFPLEKNTFRIC